MSVYAWGANRAGQIGCGNSDDQLDPVVVEHFKGTKIVQVVAGEYHSLALSASGDVYSWGRGKEGQHGDGERKLTLALPQRVHHLQHERIVQVAAGHYHCLALTDSGKVYQWGRLNRYVANSDPQGYFAAAISLPTLDGKKRKGAYYADKSQHSYYACKDTLTKEEQEEMEQNQQVTNFGNFKPYLCTIPEEVAGFRGQRISYIAAGYCYSLAVAVTGEVYSWGYNEKFQLGLGHRYNQDMPQPVKFPESVKITTVSCGQQHSLALTTDGKIYSWGLSVFGQTGLGHCSDVRKPQLIEAFEGQRISQISCGTHHSTAVTDDGKLYVWGNSEYGQMGGSTAYMDWGYGEAGADTANSKGSHMAFSRPVLFSAFNKPVRYVAAGYLHNMIILADGSVKGWGWGSSGCLGCGDRRFQLIPRQVMKLAGQRISIVACGGRHTLGILEAGSSATFAFDFKDLIDSESFCDLNFHADGKVIRAHKCLVFARCPRLRAVAAFSKRFGGGDGDSIYLPGVKYHALLSFLHYLYTDHLKVASHNVERLMHLARLFHIPRLHALCKRVYVTEEGTPLEPIPPSTFSEDMQDFVNEDFASDLCFVVKPAKERMYAHKAVVTSRCPYFRTLFDGAFKESRQNALDVNDFDPAIVHLMLHYMYTGDETVVNNPETITNLLIIADRFLLLNLKQLCEVQLEKSLDLSTVAALFELSDGVNAPRLKRACLELILREWASFVKTEGYLDFRKHAPAKLIQELKYECNRNNVHLLGC